MITCRIFFAYLIMNNLYIQTKPYICINLIRHYMKKLYFTLMALSTFLAPILAQDTDNTPSYVNEFLNIGVGAEAHGLFGSVAASTSDITSAFWNPAGLSRITAPFQANAMHAEWFGGIANYDYISFGKQLDPDKSSFGSISLIRMGIDNIPNTLSLIGPDGTVNYDNVVQFSAADYAVFFSYGQTISNKLRLGGSVKVINRSIGQFAKAWGFGADLGLIYTTGNVSVGLMAKDVTSTFNAWTFNLSDEDKAVFAQTGNVIPKSSTEIALPRFILGLSYTKPSDNVSFKIEGDLNISTNGQKAGVISSKSVGIDPTFGLEIGMSNRVYIRGGIGNIQRLLNSANTSDRSLSFQPNIGLGLKLGRIKVDYALTNIGNASDALVSHIFSLGLNFVSRSSAN